jgi:type IX secretion system PorP/SprF family membrane protein
MRKKINQIILSAMAVFGVVKAQQDPQFTQFMHSRLIYNPAYAGTNQSICFNTLYRQQWVNFPGAPKTLVFSGDMYTQALGGMGFGLNFMNDQIGADKTMYARLAIAKHFAVGADGNGILSLGLDGGVLQKQINGNWIAPQTLIDPSIPNNPSNVGGTGAPNLNKLVPDLGFGVYYSIPNKMYVGLSATHLTAAVLQGAQNSGSTAANSWDLAFQMARHYYIVGGYTFLMSNPDHAITPNVKIKSDGASTQFDVNVTYELKKTFWFGASWRMQDAIAPMLGYRQDFGKGTMKIGYSYDVTTSKIRGYSSGTHEIFLNYCFKLTKPVTHSLHGNDRVFD